MERAKLEKMLKARWHEQADLIASAGLIMRRCIDWPEKQDEPFDAVLDDMEAWLKRMCEHSDNLDVDLIFLRK